MSLKSSGTMELGKETAGSISSSSSSSSSGSSGQSRTYGGNSRLGSISQFAGENISPQVVRKLTREISELLKRPLEDISVVVSDELSDIQADIHGPVGTPYELGVFRCKLVLGPEFPAAPPKAYFLTKIFHPNISNSGEVCVNTLKRDWKSSYGIGHIYSVIRCLLIVPFPESALNEDASRMFLESYDEYAKRAKLMTQVHALPKKGTTSKENHHHHHHHTMSRRKDELEDDSSLAGKRRAGSSFDVASDSENNGQEENRNRCLPSQAVKETGTCSSTSLIQKGMDKDKKKKNDKKKRSLKRL